MISMRRGWMVSALVGALWVGLGLAAEPACAQDREAARRVFEEATRQFDLGNHSLALQGFVESRRMLEGDARAQTLVLFNVARCQEELGQFAEALRSYQEYLDGAPSDAPYREDTIDRIRNLRLRVASSTGATGSRADAPSSGAVQGDEPSALTIAGGAIAGLGALALVAAIPTGVMALDGRAELDAACLGGRCAPSEQGLLDRTYALGLATDALWIAGASLAAVGTGLLAAGLASGSESTQAVAFCTSEGCGVSLAGSF